MDVWDRTGAEDEKYELPASRVMAMTIFTGLALLVLISVVFSVAYSSQRITRNASHLHTADESLRSATVARAQVALAAFMASVDARFGTVTIDARELSQREAVQATRDLAVGIEELVEGSDDDLAELETRAVAFMETSTQIVENLEAGEIDQALSVAEVDLDQMFQALAQSLTTVRNDRANEVASSDLFLGRLGSVARFLVAFVLPAAVILIHRELARRREQATALQHRLDSERQLARSREDFIANASHELRTPLTGITGMAMILEEDESVAQSELASELVGVIITEAHDLARMVEDLLTTAQLDAGAIPCTYEDVEVAAELEEAAGSFLSQGFEVSVEAIPGFARVDRTRLRQVVRNLLSNARKYGGPNVRVEGRPVGRTYVVLVADDGDGLPAHVEEKLFERFVHRGETTGTKDSVGLGLSIVQALVVTMGGAVTYERANGETRFVVRLPLIESLTADLAAEAERQEVGTSEAVAAGATVGGVSDG